VERPAIDASPRNTPLVLPLLVASLVCASGPRVDMLDALAEATGLARGLLLFLLVLLATWPASFAFRALPPGRPRELYACVTGSALCWTAYGLVGVLNLLFLCATTYGVCGFLPHRAALIVTSVAFLHLIRAHVTNASGLAWQEVLTLSPYAPTRAWSARVLFTGRYFELASLTTLAEGRAQGTIDFTGSQMILTLKCVAFAVNIYDGRLQVGLLPRLSSSGDAVEFVSHLPAEAIALAPPTAATLCAACLPASRNPNPLKQAKDPCCGLRCRRALTYRTVWLAGAGQAVAARDEQRDTNAALRAHLPGVHAGPHHGACMQNQPAAAELTSLPHLTSIARTPFFHYTFHSA
jgi:hypothetical protein